MPDGPAQTLARFDDQPWTDIACGAREKRIEFSSSMLRLVEFSSEFVEVDWCRKQHVGFVVDGEFSIEFQGTIVHDCQGDGIYLNGDPEFEHEAKVPAKVTLFLVEPLDAG